MCEDVSKPKAVSCPQHFRHSKAGNSEANERMLPEFELIREFTPDLITCKFDDDPLKDKIRYCATILSLL